MIPARFLSFFSFLIAVLVWLSRFHLCEPVFWATHAGLHEPQRAVAVLIAWHANIWDARWLPSMDSGYGLPMLAFYSPLFSWLSGLVFLIAGDPLLAVKLNLALWLMIGVTGMWQASILLWKENGAGDDALWSIGLIGVLGWLMAPYLGVNVFLRGAFSEFACSQLLPWIAAAFLGYGLGSMRWLLVLIGAVALSILSHNFLGLTVVVIALGLGFRWWHQKKQFWQWQVAIGGALGLTAFFWLPALGERHWVHLDRIEIFRPEDNYLGFQNWFSVSQWNFGFSGAGVANTLPLHVGYGGIAALAGAVLAVLCGGPGRGRSVILVLLAAECFFLFLTSEKSLWLWQHIPLMASGQFPWRFLNYSTLVLALLLPAPYVVFRRTPLLWPSVVVVLYFVSLHRYDTPVGWYPAGLVANDPNIITSQVGDHNEYNPRWRPDDPGDRLPPGTVKATGADIEVESQSLARCQVRIFSHDSEAAITVGWNYYPLWRAYDVKNGGELPLHPNQQGSLELGPLKPGVYDVRLEIAATPLQRCGQAISLGALLALVWGIWRSRKGMGVSPPTARGLEEPA